MQPPPCCTPAWYAPDSPQRTPLRCGRLLPLMRLFLKTPAKGAATSIYLASSPEVEGVTGTYFANSKPKTSSTASYDKAAAARLWQISVGLVTRTAGV